MPYHFLAAGCQFLLLCAVIWALFFLLRRLLGMVVPNELPNRLVGYSVLIALGAFCVCAKYWCGVGSGDDMPAGQVPL
jgi:hypothetical protein